MIKYMEIFSRYIYKIGIGKLSLYSEMLDSSWGSDFLNWRRLTDHITENNTI